MIETRKYGIIEYEVYYYPTKKYRLWELPWKKLKVAYPHPILEKVLIFPTADWPHGVKKVANAGDASSTNKKSRRNLHLNNKPIRLEMPYEAYKNSSDYKSSGLMIYKKLSKEVFVKNAKNKMRVYLACRAFGNTIIRCIQENVNQEDLPAYESYILLSKKINRFVDIMTAKNGCHHIKSGSDVLVYELFDFVGFLHMWRNQTIVIGNPWLFLPYSTYEDLCWTALGTALIAMTRLPEGQTMVQSRGGLDHLEESFCMAKNKNPCATAYDSGSIMARNSPAASSASLVTRFRSRKSNGEGRKTHTVNEVQAFKVVRPKILPAERNPPPLQTARQEETQPRVEWIIHC